MDKRAEAAAQAFGRQKPPEPQEPQIDEQRVRQIVREELAVVTAAALAATQKGAQ